MAKRLPGIVMLFAVSLACSWSDGSEESVSRRVDAALATAGYEHAHWGLLVVEQQTGAVVYERNADQLFCPASVTKLFSGSAALAVLGPEFRFRTPVVRRGEVDEQGVLHGDLILVASGDLSLGGRTGADGKLLYTNSDHSYASGSFESTPVSPDPVSPLAGLDDLARGVAESGIKRVIGDILIDDRLFDAVESTGSGPTRVSPIMVNDNLVDVLTTPGDKPGAPAQVALIPATGYLSLDSQVVTVDAAAKPRLVLRSEGHRKLSLQGEIPAGHPPALLVQEVDDPASFARALLVECLRRRRVHTVASPLGRNRGELLPAASEVAKLPKVAEYTSPPFSEYLKVILKVSQNLHASTLPMLLAAEQGNRTLDAGMKREGEILQSLGVPVAGISFGGGAGGSRSDLVSPRATVALLQSLLKRPDFETFSAALPILGRDGTLSKAVGPESPARGHARAKTGTYTLRNPLTGDAVLASKALAGYLETSSGKQLVFAFFLNNVPARLEEGLSTAATTAAGQLLGHLCEIIYDDKPTAPVAAPAPAPVPVAAPPT